MAIGELLAGILPSFAEIARAPLLKPSLIWQLGPILCIWILVEFYFGTHKKEKLGWNTALTNGISLFWIVISAMQYIFSDVELFTWFKFGLISFIASYAVFVIYISFNHKFKSSVTFLFASPTPLFYFSVIVLLFAHDLIQFTSSMLISIFFLFIIILVFVTVLKRFLPEMKEDDDDAGDTFDSKHDNLDMNFGSSNNDLPSSSDLEQFSPLPSEPSLAQPDPFAQPPGDLEQHVDSFNQPNQPPNF